MNTGISHPGHSHSRLLLAVVLLAGASLALKVMVDHLPRVDSPLSQHAVTAHQGDALAAKRCLDGKQSGYLFFNPRSQRWAVACWLGDRWGIVILTAGWLVITAYVTKKLKDIERMRRYMGRQGYEEKE